MCIDLYNIKDVRMAVKSRGPQEVEYIVAYYVGPYYCGLCGMPERPIVILSDYRVDFKRNIVPKTLAGYKVCDRCKLIHYHGDVGVGGQGYTTEDADIAFRGYETRNFEIVKLFNICQIIDEEKSCTPI